MGVALTWDENGERFYEAGVDQGVLYPFEDGEYQDGIAWNGLTAVNETPSGAEANPIYADNIEYANIFSNEKYEYGIEAYTYPDEFAECDGSASIANGISIGQQSRKLFGFSYRSKIGNDEDGIDHSEKIHLVYGSRASVSERNRQTIGENVDAMTFSWNVSTTPVKIAGYKPSAHIEINASKLGVVNTKILETILYGSDADDFETTKSYKVGDVVTHESKIYVCKTAVSTPATWSENSWVEVETPGPRLPMPDELIELFGSNT